MPHSHAKVRLHVDADLAAGATVGATPTQAHYLRSVLRLKAGAPVVLFNGRDGEWAGRVDGFGKGWASLAVAERLRPQADEPGPWLLFAPIKRARLDFLVEKATELGASRIEPVITRHTVVERVNLDRLHANVVEAAEQCERLTVPEIASPARLYDRLAAWPGDRRLLVLRERDDARPMVTVAARGDGRDALLIGPEGGFARDELDYLAQLPFVSFVTLGPRILRAETAALAALACWQGAADAGDVPA